MLTRIYFVSLSVNYLTEIEVIDFPENTVLSRKFCVCVCVCVIILEGL